MLAINELTVRYGGLKAVDDASLRVREGEIVGLIGPNGAGKTTLFNTMAGLMRPDAGEVLLDAVPIQNRPPHRIFSEGLSRTFQIPRPFPEMSVLENVMLVPLGQSGERFWNNWLRPGTAS